MHTYTQECTLCGTDPDSSMDMWSGSAAAKTYRSNLSMQVPVMSFNHQINYKEECIYFSKVLTHWDCLVSMYATEF